ncbi:MAG: class I SAM-dependent methyltransferase, partial [Candidatus Dormibacteraeota bacterium]|nr:class I SAM-dependent methyltransferase [Candidatus Dormibacteraeota bacterium]
MSTRGVGSDTPAADLPDDPLQYDAMAAEYAAHNAQSAFNAYYERPATMAMLGDVSGRRVLELGCGPGVLTEWLVDGGATVAAVDASSAMVELVRTRVGDRADLIVADIAAPLAFAASHTFDLVVASLVLHYVRDWLAVLTEVRRVVTADGSVVFSTHHPFMDAKLFSADDYFAVKRIVDTWGDDSGGRIGFWRRPLTAMTEA